MSKTQREGRTGSLGFKHAGHFRGGVRGGRESSPKVRRGGSCGAFPRGVDQGKRDPADVDGSSSKIGPREWGAFGHRRFKRQFRAFRAGGCHGARGAREPTNNPARFTGCGSRSTRSDD